MTGKEHEKEGKERTGFKLPEGHCFKAFARKINQGILEDFKRGDFD